MRVLLAVLLLIATPVLATPTQRESYVGTSGGVASWAVSCLGGVNEGSVCFDVPEGAVQSAVGVWDVASGMQPGYYALALDEDLNELARGDKCGGGPALPAGSRYLVVDFPATTILGIIPECRMPAIAGEVVASFS